MRRFWLIVIAAFVGVGCVLVGFALGRNEMIYERITSGALRDSLEAAEQRLVQLEADRISAELTANVQRDAANSLRADLTAVQDANRELTAEVTFYKNLMAPGSLQKGLQISGLEMTGADTPLSYNFELLLTQVAERRRFISGNVEIEVLGKHLQESGSSAAAGALTGEPSTGERAVLKLTEIADISDYPLKFRFRYFQDLSGQMELPEHFVPDTIRILAKERDKEPLVRDFPWRIAVAGDSG